MLKSCSKCGGIHDINKTCYINEKFRKKKTIANCVRATKRWKKKAQQIKEDSQYICAVCRDNNIYNFRNLEVHHVIPIETEPSLAYDNDNLICLCNTCHRKAERKEIDTEYLKELIRRREENFLK